MSSFKLFCLIAILLVSVSEISGQDLHSCTMMDTNPQAARAACIASCALQRCSTGYCEKRGNRPTCVCSRCT
ncbi:Protein CBG09224 [Caenorhabditis briggsae]|uniref:Uncharacterized protein n=2 Tax=Caenorhabditis briggsae TaxID=6238 RepID=A0AAE9EKJ5_CAEBR|nr:Protein CBG09224 [Caenorhabditis briggsae]ULU01384.1 hypothetical protein L3Y34_001611 [Caenorhabditis briggsae]UMM24040.1 hypothetical protein L5515_004464 [Caenorhabditis briggsae]CAP28871.1 Protein CBG09224 [Caenorhabditis briggsae]